MLSIKAKRHQLLQNLEIMSKSIESVESVALQFGIPVPVEAFAELYKRYAETEAELAALPADPANDQSPLLTAYTLEELNSLIDSCLEELDIEEAVKAADELLRRDQSQESRYKAANAYYYQGNVYHYMQKLDLALKQFSYALELRPNFAKAYFSRGECFHEQQNYGATLKDWSSALQFAIREEQLEVLAARSHLYSKLGKYKYITEKYPDFVHDESPTPFAEQELSWQAVYQLALSDIDKILVSDPNPHFYYRRAEIYLHLEECQKGLEDCTEAINLWADNPFYYSLRSQLHKALSNTESAAADTKKSKELIEQHKGASKSAGGMGKEADN